VNTALQIAAWLVLSAAPVARERLPVLSAAFALETTDAADVERSAGTLAFLPGGDVCLWVTAPLRQEMRLGARELVIYYPDRDLAMVGQVAAGKAPPMLESIVAGVSDPGASLGAGSRLVEQHRADGKLLTRWHVEDGAGHELGELRAVEERAGTSSLEIYDRKGKLQRRFSFADRARVGGRSVPRAIDADFFGADGARRRHEHWTLRDVAPLDGGHPALPDCARRRPTTKVQELPW
jgi:hypothetical protein